MQAPHCIQMRTMQMEELYSLNINFAASSTRGGGKKTKLVKVKKVESRSET